MSCFATILAMGDTQAPNPDRDALRLFYEDISRQHERMRDAVLDAATRIRQAGEKFESPTALAARLTELCGFPVTADAAANAVADAGLIINQSDHPQD